MADKRKRKRAQKPKRPDAPPPPQLGRGIKRGVLGRTTNHRGMFGHAQGLQMMQSVMNSFNNLPHVLERHIDDRMQKMHSALLFCADEQKRSAPQEMDTAPPEPASQPAPEVDMSDAPGPPPSPPDTPMASADPPPPERNPMGRQNIRHMSTGAQTDPRGRLSMTTTTMLYSARPESLQASVNTSTQGTHASTDTPAHVRPRDTQLYADFGGQLRTTDMLEVTRVRKKPRR